MNRGLPPSDPLRVTVFSKRLVALLALAALSAPWAAPAAEAPKPRLPFLRRYATPAKRTTKIVVETDPDYEPEGSLPPKLPFLRRYAKPAPARAKPAPVARKLVRRPVARPTVSFAPRPSPAPFVATRQPAMVMPKGPPPPYAASPASAPTKNLPLDPSLKSGQKDPNRSIKLDMTRPYLR